ncbi:unnamed protein product [Rhizoctonia solani]|uniref:Uncharacterized protein n=1 Tax=Rhizoctonia solani TaxID=456999 RepID=A0A8H3CH33_9AGAM|nr:unnamed protein product [Rhizoctonia solani]
MGQLNIHPHCIHLVVDYSAMSTEQELENLFQVKLEEHYVEPEGDQIDQEFVNKVFSDLVTAANASDEVLAGGEEPSVFAPHVTSANLLKDTQALSYVKIDAKKLQFDPEPKVDGDWRIPGASQTFGKIQTGEWYNYKVGTKGKVLWIYINKGIKFVAYIGPNIGKVEASSGKGKWKDV